MGPQRTKHIPDTHNRALALTGVRWPTLLLVPCQATCFLGGGCSRSCQGKGECVDVGQVDERNLVVRLASSAALVSGACDTSSDLSHFMHDSTFQTC